MGILLPFFRVRLHALYSVSTERVFTVPQGVTGFRNSANTRFSEFEGNHGRGLWTTKSGKKIFHELAKLSRSRVNDILEGKGATGAASCYKGVPTCVRGYGHVPPPVDGSSGGCLAVWSISHQRGFCFRASTVRPPHPRGSSCGAPLLGRRPPAGLCAGTRVISCFHGSG